MGADHLDALRVADPEIEETVNDRVADNWRPLLAIADEAGGKWPKLAREAMKYLTGQGGGEDQAVGLQLLADVDMIFRDSGVDKLPTARLLARLTALDERPWARFHHREPITPNQLAALLRPFGISSKAIRFDDGPLKGYVRDDDLKDAISRYLPASEPKHPKQTNGDAESDPKFQPKQDPFVTSQKMTISPDETRNVSGVTAENATEPGIEGPEEPGADDLPF